MFDNTYDELTRWCKTAEGLLREQHLQNTLENKMKQNKDFIEQKDKVFEKETSIDQFIDFAHGLAQRSGVQKIQPLLSQFVAKYQQLQSLAKDVVDRWEIMVDDHKNYQRKLHDTDLWLGQLENNLNKLKSENMEDSKKRLQLILAEKDQGEQSVNALLSVGEKLLPDTATQGREAIRSELRSLRQRWDELFEGILLLNRSQFSNTSHLINLS